MFRSGSLHALRTGGHEEHAMAWQRLQGNWRQLKVILRDRWKGWTGPDRPVSDRERREELVERVQQIAREEARQTLDRWRPRR